MDRITKKAKKPRNLVQTIERVSSILNVLGQYPHGISIRELSEKVSLPKGSTHRLISSLAYFDFVRQDASTKNYNLGFKLVELGNLLVDHLDIRKEAKPFMIDLAKKTGEIIHLVILDKEEALYIDKVAFNQTGLQMMSRVGLRIPLHCSSVGKILLAFLAENDRKEIIKNRELKKRTQNTIFEITKLEKHLKGIRQQGFAIDDEENEIGIRCVAAPIRNESGKVIAAMSISGPSIRVTMKIIHDSLKDQICETALNVSSKLGFRG